MSELQEFRDRCAKAMGWAVHERNTAYYTMTGDPGTVDFQSTNTRSISSWRPDTDYNQSMMMRDRCKELGLRSQYGNIMSGNVFPTAKDIADASLKVLEEKGSEPI